MTRGTCISLPAFAKRDSWPHNRVSRGPHHTNTYRGGRQTEQWREGAIGSMTQAAGIPGITIRDFQLEDYDAVLRLWTEAGLPFRPQGRERREKVAAELMGGAAVFLLAEANGKLVGVVLGTHDGRKAWINRLAVAPAFQHRGIARLLVAEIEVRMAALGLDITAALIESHNQASLRFFHEIGYLHDPEIEYFSKRRSAET